MLDCSTHTDTSERAEDNSGTTTASNSEYRATVTSHTMPASTAPSFTSLATSLTVGLKTSARADNAAQSPLRVRAARATVPMATESGFPKLTRTPSRRRSRIERMFLGLPFATTTTADMRASGSTSASKRLELPKSMKLVSAGMNTSPRWATRKLLSNVPEPPYWSWTDVFCSRS